MKQSKESLIIELTKIKESHAGWVNGDETRRKEFAKAFSWYEQNQYGGSRTLRLPTWSEIFVELGKTLAARNFMDFEGNISELEFKLNDLENKIRKEIHPNL